MAYLPTDLHTTNTAAEFVGTHPSAIKQACDSGRLHHTLTVSGTRLIEHSELVRFKHAREFNSMSRRFIAVREKASRK